MKSKINIKSRLILLSVVVMFISLNSCQENSVVEPALVAENPYGEFSQNMTVTDESGDNSVSFTVYAHDKSVLESYMKNSFELNNYNDGASTDGNTIENAASAPEDIDMSKVVTIAVTKSNVLDNVHLSIIPHDEDARGWSFSLFVGSTAYQKWSLVDISAWTVFT